MDPYTPRKFVVNSESGHLILAETDHNAYTDDTKHQRKLQMANEMREAAGEEEQELANQMAEQFLQENLPENVFGAPKAGTGMWASCVRVLDPITGETVQQINLEQNEAALR